MHFTHTLSLLAKGPHHLLPPRHLTHSLSPLAKEELLRHQAALDLKRRRCREEARASISGLQVKAGSKAGSKAR
jgi:hypothetical protein